MRMEGRRVLLTGASGGIGAAIARALSARGAELVLSARRTDALESLRDELGESASVRPCDLADPAAVAALATEAESVDVLVANAGLPASGRVDDFTPEQIDRALDVNLRAPMQLARALVPGMVERGSGQLVFISSLAGKVASAGSAIYSATKFGLRGFAAGLREDLHGSGVGVTAVFPGFVSDAGLFAEAGVELPAWVSTVKPERVADAVVRGIEGNRGEIDVAPLSLKVGSRISALAPGAAAAVQRRLGSHELSAEIARGQTDKR
jgi:short-subunit dehydrogenase